MFYAARYCRIMLDRLTSQPILDIPVCPKVPSPGIVVVVAGIILQHENDPFDIWRGVWDDFIFGRANSDLQPMREPCHRIRLKRTDPRICKPDVSDRRPRDSAGEPIQIRMEK